MFKISNEPSSLVSELIAKHMTVGTILEPNIKMPSIKFPASHHSAVKELNVTVVSAMTKSEEYFQQMIRGVRESE